MNNKHSNNFYSSITTLATIAVLFLQPILLVNSAYAITAPAAPTKTQQAVVKVGGIVQNSAVNAANSAINSSVKSFVPASSGIAGKCVSQVVSQKVTAYASGAVIAAIGLAKSLGQVALAVPSNDLGVSSGANLQSGEGGATTVMSWIKPMTDCMIHEASMLMIDNLNMAVTNAISQGLHGSPNYSANTNQLLSALSNMISGEFRNYLNGIRLCDFTGGDQFKTGLSNSIGLSSQGSRQSFTSKIECPFPQTGARDFYNDFSKGGWVAFETSLSDNGNPFGTSLIASQKLAEDQAAAKDLAEKQLAQGNGYLPVIDESNCEYPGELKTYLDMTGDPTELANAQRLYCKVTTPGKTVADSATKAATSAWDQLNISGAIGKTMEGFNVDAAANAMKGIF